MLITSGLAVSVDNAFFVEHDQTAELVLILREHNSDGPGIFLSRAKEAKTCGL